MPNHYLGVDVGGTKIQAGLINNNKIIKSCQVPTGKKNKKAVLQSIYRSIDNLYRPDIKGIGIGITGLINSKKGIAIQFPPGLPKDWKNVPLKKLVEEKFKKPVAIDNDANAIALAVALAGQGKNYQHVLAITLGTGVGAGLVNDGQLYRGAQDAMEFGHTLITSPLKIPKKIPGSLENLVTGKGMSNIYLQITGRKLDSHEIAQLYSKNKTAAIKTYKLMSHYLAIGLANAIHSYNPEIIILNGGMASIKQIISPAIKESKKLLIYPALAKTKIVVSRLGYQAGVIGAAFLIKYPQE